MRKTLLAIDTEKAARGRDDRAGFGGTFMTVTVLLSRCGLGFAMVTAGMAVFGAVLMLTLP
jgi:hypothetical protein